MMRFPCSSTLPVLTVLGLSGLCLACQAQPDRDLGDSPLEGRSQDLRPPAPSEPFGSPVFEFAGRWRGVASDPLAFGGERDEYAFPSGSTQFALDLVPVEPRSNSEYFEGTLTFGSGSVPPLDPDQGFPSDVDYSALDYFSGGPLSLNYEGPLPPYEGFPYAIRERINSRTILDFDDQNNPLVGDGVLPLVFRTDELLRPWCALQQPQPTGTGEMSCVKGNSTRIEGDQCFRRFQNLTPDQEAALAATGASLDEEPVDCNKIYLCATHCGCTETECNLGPSQDSFGQLILRRTGDTLTGVFAQTVFLNERQLPVPLGSVYFTRLED